MRSWIIAFASLFLGTAAHAELASDWVETGHARARLIAPEAVASEVPFFLGVEVESQSGWHYYWANPGDSGIPTEVTLTAPQGYATGPLHYPVPERFEVEGLYNYGYEGVATMLLPITPPAGISGEIPATVKFSMLICHDICVPEKAEFNLTLHTGSADEARQAAAAEPFAAAQNKLPKIYPGTDARFTEANGKVRLSLPPSLNKTDLAQGDLLILTQGVTGIERPAFEPGEDNAAPRYVLPKGTTPMTERIEAVLVTGDGAQQLRFFRDDAAAAQTPQATEAVPSAALPAALPANTAPPVGFGLAMFFALLGGLILNAMPCVFPVLSLKALAIARKADAAPGVVRRHGLAYTAGVLVCFAVLGGSLLLLKAGGQSLGWGFQLQQPAFVSALCCLFLLMGLNLAGLFEWPLLGTHAHGPDAAHHPYGASFFGGLLAALVATPCTAPFMAGALGAALTMPPLAAMAIFLALGIGLAVPFLLLSLFPHLVRKMPKPGAWMQWLKEVLAFPMFGAALWLLWVTAQQLGALGLAWHLAALFFVALAAWAWRFVLFRTAALRWAYLALALAATFLLIHQAAQDRASAPIAREETVAYEVSELERLRREGKPVFVDATAAWCLTCKVNERSSLNDAEVKRAFAAQGVTLMVADWTREDPAITQFLAGFGRNGVPLYVYYPPGKPGLVLPQILTPRIVLDALSDGE